MMSLTSCLLCQNHQQKPPRLCSFCRDFSLNLSPLWTDFGLSLYPYSKSEVGSWIKNIKIGHSYPHREVLRHLIFQALKDPKIFSFFSPSRYLTPSPSSLWSRMKGRYDVAYFTAQVLSEALNKPLIHLPRSYYFALQKQTFQKKRTTILSFDHVLTFKNHESRFTTIIDDVITTGKTYQKCADFFTHEGYKNISYFTIAYSQMLELLNAGAI